MTCNIPMRVLRAFIAAAYALSCAWVSAQDYPSRLITMIVPYPPGGSVDLLARLTAPTLAERLGQKVIIENNGSAQGIVATMKTIAAPPDGHTLVLGSGREISIAKLINPNVKYDGERDLAAISLAATTPMVLVGGASLKADSIDELLRIARANPGKLTYSTPGIGSPHNLVGELIKMRAGVDITHVPYTANTVGITGLLGGHIDLTLVVLSTALPHIQAGKIKAFGVTEAKRSQAAPEIPALAENKILADVDSGIWYGLFAPAKTPVDILQRVNKAFVDALRQPSVVATLTKQSISIVGSSPVEARAYIRADTERYRKIVDAAKIRAE